MIDLHRYFQTQRQFLFIAQQCQNVATYRQTTSQCCHPDPPKTLPAANQSALFIFHRIYFRFPQISQQHSFSAIWHRRASQAINIRVALFVLLQQPPKRWIRPSFAPSRHLILGENTGTALFALCAESPEDSGAADALLIDI